MTITITAFERSGHHSQVRYIGTHRQLQDRPIPPTPAAPLP
jgi:hypothetical protein